jgi:hypothetical protein
MILSVIYSVPVFLLSVSIHGIFNPLYGRNQTDCHTPVRTTTGIFRIESVCNAYSVSNVLCRDLDAISAMSIYYNKKTPINLSHVIYDLLRRPLYLQYWNLPRWRRSLCSKQINAHTTEYTLTLCLLESMDHMLGVTLKTRKLKPRIIHTSCHFRSGQCKSITLTSIDINDKLHWLFLNLTNVMCALVKEHYSATRRASV